MRSARNMISLSVTGFKHFAYPRLVLKMLAHSPDNTTIISRFPVHPSLWWRDGITVRTVKPSLTMKDSGSFRCTKFVLLHSKCHPEDLDPAMVSSPLAHISHSKAAKMSFGGRAVWGIISLLDHAICRAYYPAHDSYMVGLGFRVRVGMT